MTDKQNVVDTHAMEYHSALERKEMTTPVTTRTKLENIMLSEINPSQKGKHCMIPLM